MHKLRCTCTESTYQLAWPTSFLRSSTLLGRRGRPLPVSARGLLGDGGSELIPPELIVRLGVRAFGLLGSDVEHLSERFERVALHDGGGATVGLLLQLHARLLKFIAIGGVPPRLFAERCDRGKLQLLTFGMHRVDQLMPTDATLGYC